MPVLLSLLKLVGRLLERAIAFTGGGLQPVPVKDTEQSAMIINDLVISKSVADTRDACATRAEMARDLFMCQWQLFFVDPIMNHQQPGA